MVTPVLGTPAGCAVDSKAPRGRREVEERTKRNKIQERTRGKVEEKKINKSKRVVNRWPFGANMRKCECVCVHVCRLGKVNGRLSPSPSIRAGTYTFVCWICLPLPSKGKGASRESLSKSEPKGGREGGEGGKGRVKKRARKQQQYSKALSDRPVIRSAGRSIDQPVH